jgi:hypothetical protein
MDEMDMNVLEMRDIRYEAVIHLVTAADGASEFYASKNNEARYEQSAEAIEKDRKLRAAYMGHPRWFLISNDVVDFNEKIKRAREAIHEVLGGNTGATFYKKFLVQKAVNTEKSALSLVPVDFKKFDEYEEINILEDYVDY